MARRKLKKHLTDDQKFSRMENWLLRMGHSKDTAQKLTEKYGMYAYDLMKKAMLQPYTLKLNNGKPIGRTDATIDYLLNNELSAETIAKNVGTSVEKVEAEIAEFRKENDIPTKLPVPEEAVQEAEIKIKKIEEKAISPLQPQKQSMREVLQTIRIGNMPEFHIGTPHRSEPAHVQHPSPIVEPAQTAQPAQTAEPVQTAAPVQVEKAPEPVMDAEQQWIEQELAKMKGANGGEISFERLSKSGLTNADMQNALTEDEVKNVHAGPKSQKLARSARKIERDMGGSGRCLRGVQYATADTLGICYGNYKVDRLPHCRSNSACFSHQAWEQCGKFTVFKFKNDRANGNACLNPPPCAGAVVNFDRGKTMHGHVTISNGSNGYDCDIHQSAKSIAKGIRADGVPYGENFYISFTNDCTVTDDLARKMLHERYIRENPNAKEQTQTNTITISREVPEAVSDSIQTVNRERIFHQHDGR